MLILYTACEEHSAPLNTRLDDLLDKNGSIIRQKDRDTVPIRSS